MKPYATGTGRRSQTLVHPSCNSGPEITSPPWCMHQPMSALDRITDSSQTSREVRKVPNRRHSTLGLIMKEAANWGSLSQGGALRIEIAR
jgi:hypothetical protein